MRRTLRSALPARCAALAAVALAGLCATSAMAAQPAAPAPAPAPAATSTTTTTTTEVRSPAGNPVVVVNNNLPAAAPAPAPIPTATPTVAVPVHTTTIPGRLDLNVYPHAMQPPSVEEREYSRKIAEQSRARSLRTAGWATLGGTYAFSALVGTISIDSAYDRRMMMYGGWMTVPVAGPFVAAFHSRTATGGLLTTSLGVAQAAGLAMALVGGHRYRVLKRQLTIAAAPTKGGAHVGLAMRF